MTSLKVKLLLYKDLIGCNYNKIVESEDVEKIKIDLMLLGYNNIKLAFEGTPEEEMDFLGAI